MHLKCLINIVKNDKTTHNPDSKILVFLNPKDEDNMS